MIVHTQRFLLACVISFVSLALHMWLQNNLFSFFVFPVVIITLLPFLSVQALAPIIITLGIFELYSTLPAGIMTLLVIVSFLLRRLFKKIEIDISLSFAGLTIATVGTQLLIITVTHILKTISWMPWADLVYTIPYHALASSWLSTSILVMSLSIMWYEIAIPKQPTKGLTIALRTAHKP